MPTYLGTTEQAEIYLGSTKIENVYLGTTRVFDAYYDLGSESAVNSAGGSGESGSVSATAGFIFNTNGTVTAISGDTSPYTDWIEGGGSSGTSYISYRIISTSSSGTAVFSAPIAASDDGSVRIAMTGARTFSASASASATKAAQQGGSYEESMDRTIQIWVWSASSGGEVLSKGTYRIAASASFSYTGEPL